MSKRGVPPSARIEALNASAKRRARWYCAHGRTYGEVCPHGCKMRRFRTRQLELFERNK